MLAAVLDAPVSKITIEPVARHNQPLCRAAGVRRLLLRIATNRGEFRMPLEIEKKLPFYSDGDLAQSEGTAAKIRDAAQVIKGST